MTLKGKIARLFGAAACLGISLGAAGAWADAAAPNPVKTIKIFNNSDGKIYPVIETSPSDADEWLQGLFRTTNIARDTYTHAKVYRVYAYPPGGIGPKDSVILKVPFYSDLVANPKATKPDQYIDWWNGARVYLYDDRAAVTKQRNLDTQVKPLTPGLTCAANSACGPLAVYTRGRVGLPVNDPNQLMEWELSL